MWCNTCSKRGKTLPIEANQFTNRGLQAWPRTLFLSRKIRADPKVLKLLGLILAGIIEGKIQYFVLLSYWGAIIAGNHSLKIPYMTQ